MKAKDRADWKEIRSKGMLNYVLFHGVLLWGVPMFVVMTFIVHSDRSDIRSIGISAILWPIGGALFGIVNWLNQETKFKKAQGP